jgi:hypothetical protein
VALNYRHHVKACKNGQWVSVLIGCSDFEVGTTVRISKSAVAAVEKLYFAGMNVDMNVTD